MARNPKTALPPSPTPNRGRIAVVGYAFRFPGPGGERFWTSLCEGRDLVGAVDDSRWEPGAFFHPRESEPGTAYTRAGGSLGDVSGFDAAFFGISPREAAQMDPQQRLLLELTWEALEAGGIPPSSIRGSRCGVMVGFSGSDYGYLGAEDVAAVNAFSMTGINGSISANRISYVFDLRGPSMAVDTACSSSLVAFHQACGAILAQDADAAIVGAVNLHLHPLATISGTYYVRTPRGCSALKFEDPRLDRYMAAPPRRAGPGGGAPEWVSVPARQGGIVLFESWLRHEVPANPVAAERVSISFNYSWF